MTEEAGYLATKTMLAQHVRPTALLVSSIILAIGARRAIDQAGLTLGRDVSLVAYDDDLSYLSNRQDVPMFTAVRSSVREAGRLAAQMLIDRIADVDSPPGSHLLETELVVGTSTGPLPA